jgi:hypothetical protein
MVMKVIDDDDGGGGNDDECDDVDRKNFQMEAIKWSTKPSMPSPALIWVTTNSKAETREQGFIIWQPSPA